MSSQGRVRAVCPIDHSGLSPTAGAAPTVNDIVYIDSHLDPAAEMEVVYWRDIRAAFNDAVYCYLKTVKKDHAYAQFAVGKLYFDGKDVAQDYTKSITWDLKAAELGLADGQDVIYDHYFYGYGVPKDDSKALEWVFKAVDQGFPAVMRSVGFHYYGGLGVIQHFSVAME
ncbi:MAG: hypothetical protein J3R72DRAFT_503073 [Linnemannia gamsii]|nr:MAG: hypothetical protein J3R72DRAFT_503073 [Linnemannia gamsii]